MNEQRRVLYVGTGPQADHRVDMLRTNQFEVSRSDRLPLPDPSSGVQLVILEAPDSRAAEDLSSWCADRTAGQPPLLAVLPKVGRSDRERLIGEGVDDLAEAEAHPVEFLARARALVLRQDTPRSLIVEDDELIADEIRRTLEAEGHICRIAASLNAAHDAFAEGPIDVIVLDRRLPTRPDGPADGDGLQFLRLLRAGGIRTPTLIESAMNLREDLIRGLDGGAEDYICKPFDPLELAARVRVLLRPRLRGEEISIGALDLLRRVRQAHWRGEDLELTPKEFEVLDYLLRRAGISIPTAMLLVDVWRQPFGEANTVNKTIERLRRKLAGHGLSGAVVTEVNRQRSLDRPTTYRGDIAPILMASGIGVSELGAA